MRREEWTAAFAPEVGVQPPSAEQIDELLALAAVAAHASERPAAPLACWVARRSSLSGQQLLEAARRISAGGGGPADGAM